MQSLYSDLSSETALEHHARRFLILWASSRTILQNPLGSVKGGDLLIPSRSTLLYSEAMVSYVVITTS